jgi:L-rhamnose-H+ transport protein
MDVTLGIILHLLGGLCAASFYLPYRAARGWRWASVWLAGGVVSWLIAPWVVGFLTVPNLLDVLQSVEGSALAKAYAFGCLWGIGGLSYGLSVRWLGVALGNGVALGACAVVGTLYGPISSGQIGTILDSTGGQVTMLAVAVCVGGIALSTLAGHRREQGGTGPRTGNLSLGLLVALLAGIFSAAMSMAFTAGEPVMAAAKAQGTDELWTLNALLPVVLAGGLTTNLIWCVWQLTRPLPAAAAAAAAAEPAPNALRNAGLAAAGGLLWFGQFMFYGMGHSKLTSLGFASWTLHMSFIILGATAWGLLLGEWKAAPRVARAWLFAGVATLVLSTVLVGVGNYIGTAPPAEAPPADAPSAEAVR